MKHSREVSKTNLQAVKIRHWIKLFKYFYNGSQWKFQIPFTLSLQWGNDLFFLNKYWFGNISQFDLLPWNTMFELFCRVSARRYHLPPLPFFFLLLAALGFCSRGPGCPGAPGLGEVGSLPLPAVLLGDVAPPDERAPDLFTSYLWQRKCSRNDLLTLVFSWVRPQNCHWLTKHESVGWVAVPWLTNFPDFSSILFSISSILLNKINRIQKFI